MNAGRFDRLITFQVNTPTRDNIGGKVDAWADYCSMWALYQSGAGFEQVNADRQEAKSNAIFTIRYRDDIRNSMRIVFQGEYYNIQDISEITRRAYLKINAISLTS